MKNKTTPVKFYIEEGDVLAVFLAAKERIAGLNYCLCYSHESQHGVSLHAYHRTLRPATRAQYKCLATELEDIGYTLKIIHK